MADIAAVCNFYLLLHSKERFKTPCKSTLCIIRAIFNIDTDSDVELQPVCDFYKFKFILSIYFGAIGIILGWFGIKGGVRGTLLVANILAIIFYLIVFLMGTVGFQQP